MRTALYCVFTVFRFSFFVFVFRFSRSRPTYEMQDQTIGPQANLFGRAFRAIDEKAKAKHEKSQVNDDTLLKKLRWVTVGYAHAYTVLLKCSYHYNWTERTYHPTQHNRIPDALSQLSVELAQRGAMQIVPQAGIINYYLTNSTLCGFACSLVRSLISTGISTMSNSNKVRPLSAFRLEILLCFFLVRSLTLSLSHSRSHAQAQNPEMSNRLRSWCDQAMRC
jgi:hypothetical protein